MKVALKQLRQLNRVGLEDELDLDKTIEATCKNAGELEFKWKRPRKNSVKLLLLMDAGGSMEPFADLCSQLFSAANHSTISNRSSTIIFITAPMTSCIPTYNNARVNLLSI